MELSARETYDGSLLIWMEIKLTLHAHQGLSPPQVCHRIKECRVCVPLHAFVIFSATRTWRKKKARDWYQDLLEVRGQRCYRNGWSKNISSLSSLPREGKKNITSQHEK